ncbi:MAG: hypothetical protein AAFQ32_04550 [Pseudomonadota bacterium]
MSDAAAVTTPEDTDTNAGLNVSPDGSKVTVDPAEREAAAAAAAQAEEEAGLLAGKFKTPEELEKAYKELASKLGAPKVEENSAPEDEAAAEADGNNGPEDNTTHEGKDGEDDLSAVYGETVANAMKTAEVDASAAAEEFEKTGDLSEETYAKFEKAGFNRDVVKAYLKGVSDTNEAVTEVTEAQIAEIKEVAGGEAAFGDLQKWMGQNMSDDEAKAYHAALEAGDPEKIKAQVKAYAERYRADIGEETTPMGGRTAAAEQGYQSVDEHKADVRDPRYKKDASFREQVRQKLRKSNIYTTR